VQTSWAQICTLALALIGFLPLERTAQTLFCAFQAFFNLVIVRDFSAVDAFQGPSNRLELEPTIRNPFFFYA
jgi:hypothetical protein